LKDDRDTEHRMTRWRRIALEATKQSGRARVPRVLPPTHLAGLFQTSTTDRACLMFSERLGTSFEEAVTVIGNPTSITALVGSEGGWADDEIEQASSSGWRILTLAGRTLRAETAAIAATVLLQHRFGDLK